MAKGLQNPRSSWHYEGVELMEKLPQNAASRDVVVTSSEISYVSEMGLSQVVKSTMGERRG
jgi:hypothetical protein